MAGVDISPEAHGLVIVHERLTHGRGKALRSLRTTSNTSRELAPIPTGLSNPCIREHISLFIRLNFDE